MYWADFAIVIVVLLAVALLRQRARLLAIRDDRARWTTGDYAVLLRGLCDGLDPNAPHRVEANELHAALSADLADLGYGPSSIVQIEMGRRCRAEFKLLKRLELLNVKMHELVASSADAAAAAANAAAPTAATTTTPAPQDVKNGGNGGSGSGERLPDLTPKQLQECAKITKHVRKCSKLLKIAPV